jgi:hypothetical protein
MAGIDPREAFAAFRASCWQKATAIKVFVTGRTSFEINSAEFLKLGLMREALAGQYADMEERWDNLLQCVREYSIDTDSDVAFKELEDVMKSTKRVVNATLDLSGLFTQTPEVVGVPDADEDINVNEDMKAADGAGGNMTGVEADNENRQDSQDGACTGGLEENARGVEAGPHNTDGGTEGKDVRVCRDTETVDRPHAGKAGEGSEGAVEQGAGGLLL